jgi:hypothetical protein
MKSVKNEESVDSSMMSDELLDLEEMKLENVESIKMAL